MGVFGNRFAKHTVTKTLIWKNLMTLNISNPSVSNIDNAAKSSLVRGFAHCEKGGTAIEYAFVAGLLFVVTATAVHFYADALSSFYMGFTGEIQKVMGQ
jgi:Flp pilus assembly pilin Flp